MNTIKNLSRHHTGLGPCAIAFLVVGSISTPPLASASDSIGIVARAEGSFFYTGVLCGGADLNGDGINDFVNSIVVANQAQVAAYEGVNGDLLFAVPGIGANDTWGASIRISGDANNDGTVDILVGTKWDGYARILSGKDGFAFRTFVGSAPSHFGRSVDFAGDFDGDGNADVVVASPNHSPWGIVQVFNALNGALIGTYTPPQSTLPHNAFLVAGLGDTNGDGFSDLAYSTTELSLSGPGTLFGRIRVLLGPSGFEPYTLVSGQDDDGYAYHEGMLRRAGDIDGDGFEDLLASASDFVNGSPVPKGRVFAHSGFDGTPLLGFSPPAGSTSGFYGRAIDAIGDLDSDGSSEIAIGDSKGKDAGVPGDFVGAIRVYSGTSGNVLRTYHGNGTNSGLGSSLAAAGDMNANGRPDILTVWGPNSGPSSAETMAFTTNCGAVIHHGAGCPGALGTIPSLTVTANCPSPGVPLSISIVGSPFGPTFAMLVAGTSSGSYTLGPNCSLLVGGTTVVFPLALNLFGLGTLTFDLPLGFTQDFAVQAFLPAPGTPLGYSGTRAAFVQVD